MIIIIFIHFLSIITNSDGQSYCTPQNPFRLHSSECTTFENVCYKKNDPQCDELQNACKYCPASNITLIALQDIFKINQNNSQLISDALRYSNKSVNLLENRSSVFQNILNKIQNNFQLTSMEIKTIVEKSNQISISILILIVINIILILVIAFLVNNKYGLWGQSETHGGIKTPVHAEEEYALIQNDTYAQGVCELIRKDINEPVQAEEQVLIQNDTHAQVNSRSTITKGNLKVKFKLPQKRKAIQMYVNSSDNIIKLKKKVCKRISNLSQDENYKKMIFKYNGKILNDNHYLLSYLICNTIPIYCEFCNNIDHKNICILKIEGKENLPGILQIKRDEKIYDLKKIISELINCECDQLILYYDSKELEKDKTIEECKLKDNFKIIAKKRQIENVTVHSILTDIKPCTIQYSYDQNVEDFKRKLGESLKLDFNKIFLYNDGDLMMDKRSMYEYYLDYNSKVEYYHPMNADKIEPVNKGKREHLLISERKSTKQSILLLQYSFPKLGEKDKLLIYHHSKSENSSLVNITGVYQQEDDMYIAMDNIFSGTIVSYLRSNEPDLSRIIMWTKQIIPGLKYFHDNGIYLGYLNPLNILIDGNHHVKILAFPIGLDEFYNKNDEKIEIKSFVENEILDNKRQPDSQCDVWSLGAILTYISTGKPPEYKLEDKIKGSIRRKHYTEEINRIDPSKYLYHFICGMTKNKNDRSTLAQLMDQLINPPTD